MARCIRVGHPRLVLIRVPVFPAGAVVGGTAGAVAAFCPIHPAGLSFFDLLLIELSFGWLQGLLMLLGMGSPFLFALAVVAVPVLPATWRRLALTVPLIMVHSQLVLVACVLVLAPSPARAPILLLLFALSSGTGLAYAHAHNRASDGEGLSLSWLARWGATVILGVCVWAELQRFGGVRLEWGLHLLLLGMMTIGVSLRVRDHSIGPVVN